MSKKKTAIEEEVSMDMTPMIDVTFQLLIFFIITLKFKLLEKKLKSHLPTDFGLQSTSEPIDENFTTIKLRQSANSKAPIRDRATEVFLDNQKVNGKDAHEIYSRIRHKIAGFIEQQKDAKGKIDVGPGVPHSQVVLILDLFNRTGYKTVTFVGLPKSRGITQGNSWWNKMRRDLATTN